MEQNQMPVRRFYRSNSSRIIFGVCGGLGEYFGIDPIVFRIIFVALTFGAGSGVLLYILMAILVPREPDSASGAPLEGQGKVDLKERAHGLASEFKEHGFSGSRRNWLGIIIVAFGIILLLDQLFPKNIFNWHLFWPALIIIMGLIIIRKNTSADKIKITSQKQSTSDPLQAQQTAEAPQKESVREIHHYHHGGGMGRLFFGLLLLVIGFAYLARNFGLISGINVNFDYLLRLWPVFIILIGLSLLSRGTLIGAVLSTVFTFAVIALIVISFFLPAKTLELKNYNFDIARNPSASRADVVIKEGAATLTIDSGASGIAAGSMESNAMELFTNSVMEDSTQRVTISSKGSIHFFGGHFENNMHVNLAEDIPTSLTINAGASSLDLDLSKIRVENLRIDAGASKINLILGDKPDTAAIDIKAGVSSIEISLPRDLGVRIKAKADLSTKSFSDFRQLDEDSYESNNYALSAKKMEMSIDAGASNIMVNWR